MSPLLKLIALDSGDLTTISAFTQDAVCRVDDIDFSASTQQLSLTMRRFVWEAPGAKRWLFPKKERRLSVLHFNRVRSIRSIGIDQNSSTQVLSLLAIEYDKPLDDEDTINSTAEASFKQSISLIFAGGASMLLDIEAIELQLSDMGAAWQTEARPRHKGNGSD